MSLSVHIRNAGVFDCTGGMDQFDLIQNSFPIRNERRLTDWLTDFPNLFKK